MDNFEKQEMDAVLDCVVKFHNNQELGAKARRLIRKNARLVSCVRNFPNDQELGREIRKMFMQ